MSISATNQFYVYVYLDPRKSGDFILFFEIFNFAIIDFTIYNVFHMKNQGD